MRLVMEGPSLSASLFEASCTSESFWEICTALLFICSVNCLMSLLFLGARFWLMAAREAWSNSLICTVNPSIASSHSLCPGALSLMEETNFLMESETDLLLLARACHVGGSLGLTAKLLALWIIAHEPAMICFPESKIGIWASRPSSEILAGTEANSGELANWHKLSTASMSGRVEFAVESRFSSV